MSQPREEHARVPRTNRRRLLRGATGAALFGAAALGGPPARARAGDDQTTEPAVRKGRIKQSIVHWCFEDHWSVEQTIAIARRLGCESVELIDPQYFPQLRAHGLVCAIGQIDMRPDPPFVKGFNNPEHHERVIQATRVAIDACAAFGFSRVIAFTGMRNGMPDDVGADHCVAGFKKILGHAEQQGVTLCLEMLNSRVDDHPMKGHPGYQGDHTEYCVEIIRRVGSPNLKLLFDIYHVQIMDGDIIRRIHQHKDLVAHVHTAGNPGRGELDDRQELQYRPIMEALVEIGYDGFVGQEFLPTRDPLESLRQAVALCDV